MPIGSLGTAVNSLIKGVGSKVFGKPVLEKEVSVTVEEIFCKNLKNFARVSGLIIGLPASHTLLSMGKVSFNEPFGIHRLLARWRKTIEAQLQYRQNDLVHFCPLNVNSNHFTLLEINKRERVIYHYDSMTGQGVINGRVKQTQVGEILRFM